MMIEAIITAGYDNLQETLLRAEALEEIKDANFNKLLTALPGQIIMQVQ